MAWSLSKLQCLYSCLIAQSMLLSLIGLLVCIAALMEEQAMPEDPPEDAPAEDMIQDAPAALPEPQQRRDVTPHNGAALQGSMDVPPEQPHQNNAAEAMPEDGWDFEDSALEGLGDMEPLQAHERADHAPAVGSSSAAGIQIKAEDAYGNGSVAGMSPPGGNWEGESELNFPLDDVPKDQKSALSSQGAPFPPAFQNHRPLAKGLLTSG